MGHWEFLDRFGYRAQGSGLHLHGTGNTQRIGTGRWLNRVKVPLNDTHICVAAKLK